MNKPRWELQHPRFRAVLLGVLTGIALSTGAVVGQSTQAPQGSPPQAPMPSVHVPEGHSGQTTAIEQPDLKTDQAPARTLPPVVPGNRRSIGLVLDGGGALGLAHIGVLRWFEENHIPVDRIAGTSMGSLIGALYATGGSAHQLEEIATSPQLVDVFQLGVDYDKLSFRRREDGRELPGAIPVGLKDGVSLRNAVLTDRGLNAFLHGSFQSYDAKGLHFDDLPIPFRCVATDLNTLRAVVFDGGPVPLAVRASISIPGVFSPVDYQGHYLVDGAIMDNLPVGVARNDLRSDVVIAVELPASAFAEGDVGSVVGVFARAFSAGTASNERASEKLADLILLPATQNYGTGDYGKAQQLMDVGYAAAEAQRVRLLPYALSPGDWRQYLAAKESRRRALPGRLQSVAVSGGSPGADRQAQLAVNALRGQPIQPGKVVQALNSVEGNRTYEAEFETVPSPAGDGRTANDSTAPGPDTGLAIHLEPTRNGPPFLLVGLDASAVSGNNVTRTTFDLRLIDNDLGGYGSELRTDIRLGFLTEASTEYYRQLRADGLFLQPHLGALRTPVYIYSNQQRIAERLQQNAGGGLDLGRTFSSHLQLAAEWRAQTIRWHTQTGSDGLPDLSGAAQSAVAHLVFDNRDSGQISLNGLRIDLSAGSLYRAVASTPAPLLQLESSFTTTLAGKNVVGFSVNADSYFRRDVADPLRFTLGGPLRLSASSIDEYRGTDDALVRAGYLHRIASLPTQLGEGLYFTTAYEAGEIWSPERPSFLRQDGVLGVLAATPVGSITLAGSLGDGGRRKFFFTFGRLF